MHITLLVITLLSTIAAAVLLWRCMLVHDRVDEAETRINVTVFKLRDERARVTVVERDLDALRRELRKLSGKFYASQRDCQPIELHPDYCHEHGGHLRDSPACDVEKRRPLEVCENWAVAKHEGPHSDAAKCDCLYCMTQRADRARTRAALVPKGAQAAAATAKLNSGKP